MLHVRVVSPVALTEQLTSLLATAPGVQNMVTRAGAVRRPTGDAVEFDIRDGAANPVFAAAQRQPADRGRRGRPQRPARDLAQAADLTAVTFRG